MGDAGLRGTNTTQDVRFKNKEKMALKATKFPKEFTEKVDIRKVNLAIMRPWVTKTVTELAGVEDDIVIEFVMELLESKEEPVPDPRKMQISLGGFLTPENAAEFMLRLWKLLLSAQASHGGIPAEFVEAKKQELLKKQDEEAKMQQNMMAAGGRRDQGRPPSRFDDRDRAPVPRDRDGRAFPQDRDSGNRSYQGGRGGYQGVDRNQARDTYIPSDLRRDDNGRGGGERPMDGGYQRGYQNRPREGYGDRRAGDFGGQRSADPYQGNAYRDLNRKPDFVPRRGRYFEENDRSSANTRGRSMSRSRSRSRSRPRADSRRSRSRSATPPRRKAETSATPPRRRRDRDDSATPPASGRKLARRRERSRSRSATPPRNRRAASRERRSSPDVRKRRRTEDERSARRGSVTPPRRSARDYTPTPSPPRRNRSRTPPRRKRSVDPVAKEDSDPFNKERVE